MKGPDEIKKGLEHCINGTSCRGCPYCEECAIASDCNPMQKDLQGYIQQLQAENDRLTDEVCNAYNVQNEQLARIQQLEAERDAAVEALKDFGGCMACKSANVLKRESPCKECILDGQVTRDYWMWRGVQKEE